MVVVFHDRCGECGGAVMTPAMSQIATRIATCSAIASIRGDQVSLEICQGTLDHLAICKKLIGKAIKILKSAEHLQA